MKKCRHYQDTKSGTLDAVNPYSGKCCICEVQVRPPSEEIMYPRRQVDEDYEKVMRVGRWLSPQNKKDTKELIVVSALLLFLGIVLLFLCFFSGCAYAEGEIDVTKAVVHHTSRVTDKNQDPSASEINRWHKERGWDGIGYHFVIRKDGRIEKGRNIHKHGAHAPGRNNRIGIVLTGSDHFTGRQIASLRKLISDLGIQDVERHHEQCPGTGLNVENLLK